MSPGTTCQRCPSHRCTSPPSGSARLHCRVSPLRIKRPDYRRPSMSVPRIPALEAMFGRPLERVTAADLEALRINRVSETPFLDYSASTTHAYAHGIYHSFTTACVWHPRDRKWRSDQFFFRSSADAGGRRHSYDTSTGVHGEELRKCAGNFFRSVTSRPDSSRL
jgi:hypothetical protein